MGRSPAKKSGGTKNCRCLHFETKSTVVKSQVTRGSQQPLAGSGKPVGRNQSAAVANRADQAGREPLRQETEANRTGEQSILGGRGERDVERGFDFGFVPAAAGRAGAAAGLALCEDA